MWRPAGWLAWEHARGGLPLAPIGFNRFTLSSLVLRGKIHNPGQQQDKVVHGAIDGIESADRCSWRTIIPALIRHTAIKSEM